MVVFSVEDWLCRCYNHDVRKLFEYRFSHKLVFTTISELLKKDAGLHVKKQALRLMYLVLNCKFPPITSSSSSCALLFQLFLQSLYVDSISLLCLLSSFYREIMALKIIYYKAIVYYLLNRDLATQK